MNTIGNIIAFFVTVAFVISASAAWVYAIWIDASQSNLVWVLVDLFAPFIGIIRGLILFFGA